MNRTIWTGFAISVLAVGGWWYLNQQRTSLTPGATQQSGDRTMQLVIDKSSLNTNNYQHTTLNGNASASKGVYIFAFSPTYKGSLDYNSVAKVSQGDLEFQDASTGEGQTRRALPSPATVINGHWQATFGDDRRQFGFGSYTIVIYDSESHQLLAKDTLLVHQ